VTQAAWQAIRGAFIHGALQYPNCSRNCSRWAEHTIAWLLWQTLQFSTLNPRAWPCST